MINASCSSSILLSQVWIETAARVADPQTVIDDAMMRVTMISIVVVSCHSGTGHVCACLFSFSTAKEELAEQGRCQHGRMNRPDVVDVDHRSAGVGRRSGSTQSTA